MAQEDERIDAKEIKSLVFPKRLGKILVEMEKIMVHFFSNPERIQIPFRGFLLEGPPGNGKTELAKQVARNVAVKLESLGIKKVSFLLIDSASIAAAKWGDAERKIKNLFKTEKSSSEKIIMLIDDIDCLMIKRGASVAVEWHYSINSILFHQLDKNDPSKIIIIATTNRTDLVDEALRSRLYFYELNELSREELEFFTDEIVDSMYIDEKEKLKKRVVEQLTELEENIKNGSISRVNPPNIRDIQHFITKIYIEEIS